MSKGLSRRNLFKYMGVAGATATAAGCQQKPEKLIPMLVPPTNFEYAPSEAYNYMTTCRECDAACGMMVTVREHRAQKAEGNPNHPLNQGALCARGQASMQALYNPDRLAAPSSKAGGAITWEQGLKELTQRLNTAGGQVVYLGRPETGTGKAFVAEWLQAVGGGRKVTFDLLSRNALVEANRIAFGKAMVPDYVFEEAQMLINFSSDFLESWGNQVENSRRFVNMHAYQNGQRREFVQVSPQVSLTASKADRWVPINPGTEGLMALSLAHVVRNQKGGYAWLESYLDAYAPEKVASAIGVEAEKITELAEAFSADTPSLALGGGPVAATEAAVEMQVAINILNAVAGNLNRTVVFPQMSQEEDTSHQQVVDLINDLNAGRVKVLVVDDSNPLYALPPELGMAAALQKAYVVSLASMKSETTSAADLVLPALTAYETWGDAAPRAGVRSLQQPVMAPVNTFDAKAREDVMITVAKGVRRSAFDGITTYKDYLQKAWMQVQNETGRPGLFDNFWVSVLEDGGVFGSTPTTTVTLSNAVTGVSVPAPTRNEGLTLLVSSSLLKADGSGANKPWLQEVPDPMSQIVWDSWLEIHPDTAKEMGIDDRDVVEVTTSQGTLSLMAYYYYGIHRQAVAIPMGQGHESSGAAADGFGVNVMTLLPVKQDSSGNLVFSGTAVEVKGTGSKGYTVNMDGNPRQAGRDIAAAATVAELASGDAGHGAAHKRKTEMYPDRAETAGYYKPYRWGMTIDLDRCTGCSACVVACYADNNIPVVGKERAAVGREMSWIRLERYFEGYGDDFETRIVPMMCQQCGNAGCEPVCPVYATYHNPEGLNAMIYNRCVGTRYCSNNCAYKVRRFNWFSYEFPAPLDQQLNSTMTTREKGVMEKCNFCVPRLTYAKRQAKALGRDLRDGEVMTACQQTCPTQAITFGNLSDPNSRVSQLAMRDDMEERDRQYEVFPELNFKPAVTYLKKVNTREVSGHSDGAEHA